MHWTTHLRFTSEPMLTWEHSPVGMPPFISDIRGERMPSAYFAQSARAKQQFYFANSTANYLSVGLNSHASHKKSSCSLTATKKKRTNLILESVICSACVIVMPSNRYFETSKVNIEHCKQLILYDIIERESAWCGKISHRGFFFSSSFDFVPYSSPTGFLCILLLFLSF